MNTAYAISLTIVIATVAISFLVYPFMPDEIPSHWNAKGEIDGHMDKFWGLAITPIVAVPLLLLFIAIPKIDPLKENVKKFTGQYNLLINVILGFLLYMHVLIVIASLGFAFNMAVMILPAIGAMFYFIGSIMQNLKMNWFVGIKTPWTLSSERVWNKTHEIGGKLFKLLGLIAVIGAFFGEWGFWIFISATIAVSAYVVAFSYFEYRKETDKK